MNSLEDYIGTDHTMSRFETLKLLQNLQDITKDDIDQFFVDFKDQTEFNIGETAQWLGF